MSVLKKYWMGLLSLVLVLAAAVLVFMKYLPAKQLFETEKSTLTTQNMIVQTQLMENQRYANVQDQLAPAREAIEASRTELYAKFPVEMKEEDQIMYMLYLEDKFGKEVTFSFTQAETILTLSDGAELQGMTFAFDYETSYAGFKKMIQELATDSRITSVRYATLDYNAAEDSMTGQMVVTVYLMDDGRAYEAPSVAKPSVGKDNPYKK